MSQDEPLQTTAIVHWFNLPVPHLRTVHSVCQVPSPRICCLRKSRCLTTLSPFQTEQTLLMTTFQIVLNMTGFFLLIEKIISFTQLKKLHVDNHRIACYFAKRMQKSV